MLSVVVIALASMSSPAQAHCFDVGLPSGHYSAEPICAQTGALHASLPRCAPIDVAVVDGCLAFPRGEVSEAVDARVIKRGRAIKRQLVARDSCGTHWEIDYRVERDGLVATARAGSRCDEVALTKAGGQRTLSRGPAREGLAKEQATVARDLLALQEGEVRACERLARVMRSRTPVLVEQVLLGVDRSGACLAKDIEAHLAAKPRLAQKALTRVLDDDALSEVALREIDAGRSVVALIKALKEDPDRVLPLRESLRARLTGLKSSFRPAALALLELDPERGAESVLEVIPADCDDARFALGLFEVRAALEKTRAVERTFIPLLAPGRCPDVRRLASAALVVRLAEGRAASPAAWRALFSAMDSDELLARELKRSLRERFRCDVRRDDVSLPAFAYDRLLELGVQVPCAQLGPLELSKEDPGDDSPGPLNDPAAAAELREPLEVAPDEVPEEPDEIPDAMEEERETEPRIKPRGLEEMQLNTFGAVYLQQGGGLGGIGLGGAWLVDDGFGFVASATLGLMCAECFNDEQIHRRDLRFALGVRTLWFPDEVWSPYVLGNIILGDAEIASDARSARSFLIGADIGLGLEWLMTDDFVVFSDLSAFVLGEAETSFPSGIPQANGIPTLGREQVGALLKVGVGWRL